MPRRGPYKQYEVDASIAVPKSTLYDRRKRRLMDNSEDDSVDNYEDFHPFIPLDQAYVDDYDMQV